MIRKNYFIEYNSEKQNKYKKIFFIYRKIL
jgi:hypothetical protein